MTPEQKNLLMKIASFTDVDTSAFILQYLLKETRKKLQTINRITLSNKDSAIFLNALVNAPKPNNNLQSAYNEYKKIFN
jgi:uncharacterized protein (DUF1778 family)